MASRGSSVHRLPTAIPCSRCPVSAMTVVLPSGSNRSISAASAPRTRPISSVTVLKTSAGGTPRATRVATQRSAACSSRSRVIWLRLSALAIALPTSSVNSTSLSSVAAGKAPPRDPTPKAPHTRPSTTIGQPTTPRIPCLSTVPAMSGRCRRSSMRTTAPSRNGTSEGGTATVRPTSRPRPCQPLPARKVAEPSGSNRTSVVRSAWRSRAASSPTAVNTSRGCAARAASGATLRSAPRSCESHVGSCSSRRQRPTSCATSTAVSRRIPRDTASRGFAIASDSGGWTNR
jgi:hypothetical protein